jgi:hypothetical protein
MDDKWRERERAKAERYRQRQRLAKRGRGRAGDRGRGVKFDESGFALSERDGGLVQRVARLLKPL